MNDPEMVWYSPEWDEWRVSKKSEGFLFKNSFGEFHICYKTYGTNAGDFKLEHAEFYLMGPF